MSSQAVIALVSVVFLIIATIITHIVASVWWASKITTTLEFIKMTVGRLEKHHDGYYMKEQAIKDLALQSQQNSALWKDIEDLRVRVERNENEIAFIKGGQQK